MWATEMGRDNLGDNLPPDEINVITEGSDFGWPICYGNNIHDTNFDKKVYIQNPCNEKVTAKVELQAHSAPLGLGFIPEEGWPEDYWYDLIVAYHGSWNRSVPTGYKLVRVKLDSNGNLQGVEDFITGWLTGNNRALGRPTDVLIQPGGTMYVTDDSAGVVYRIVRI
jgi:glucose/arabinose dehydrogenase